MNHAKKKRRADRKEPGRGWLHQVRRSGRLLSPVFSPHWKMTLLLLLASILLAASVLIYPLLIKFLVDTVLVGKRTDLLFLFVAIYAAASLVIVALRVAYEYFSRVLQLRISFGMRDVLFERLEVLGTETVKRYKVGDLLERLDVDVEAFENVFDKVTDFILDIFSLVFMAAMTFILDWRIALAILAVIPLYALSQKFYVRETRRLYQMVRSLSSGLLSFFEERLTAVTITKIFGRERYELAQEKRRARQLIRADTRATLLSSTASTLIGLITTFMLLVILWYGGTLVIQGAVTIGTLIAVYTYAANIFDPVESMAGFWREMQEPLASISRVEAILATRPHVRDLRGAKPMHSVRGGVEFEHVWFRYGQEYVLRDVSFKVKPGEHVGIVGPSGSGKTTLAMLLPRFYDPERGRVLIDGKDVRDVTLESLRGSMGYLPQEPTIFSASVYENIKYAKAGATERDVREAARRAGADVFIRRLNHGYATRLGQQGSGLSGGERQRIALARLFLKDPSIVILDEPAAFLDAMTEESVRLEFHEFFANRTFFVISHRAAFLRGVDKVFVLEGRRLKQCGPPTGQSKGQPFAV